MDGFETAQWIKKNRPKIKIIVLSMMDDENSIIRMIRHGARGYLLKDSRPVVLKKALYEVLNKGFFYNELVSGKMVHMVQREDGGVAEGNLSDKESEFLKWCCSEKSYKEIALEMNISPRAVETLRSNLFDKVYTQSRVGLVMYALRHGIVKL